MTDDSLDVVEFLLTTRVYNKHSELDENDLSPQHRRVFWRDGEIERPLRVTTETASEATNTDQPWEAISGLLFTERDDFTGEISFTQPEMAESWFLDRADDERLANNPTLAFAYQDRDGVTVDYEEARSSNRPIQADRVWIDSLLEATFTEDDDDEMLDLVDVRAPEEIETTLDDIVLTEDQREEIQKIMKAIEYREFLAEIGLREIGKLLFVGPPGTGKTTASRGLAHELDLPFVEVKLSMITSQYLGETAKNVDKVFEVAKRLAPCILFIDEFDFVAKTRRSDEHAAIKRAVNTLLKSIDEVSLVRDEVLLIGATNHPDELDAAAWRRFDEIVNFPKPDEEMRSAILSIITRQMQISDFDPDAVAALTEGLTGSDLRLVMREAVLEALTENRQTLTQRDLLDAVTDFEERDTLRGLDMIDGDHEALVAGGTPAGSGSSNDQGHDHQDHDHGNGHDHDHHDHPHAHDHANDD